MNSHEILINSMKLAIKKLWKLPKSYDRDNAIVILQEAIAKSEVK